MDQPKTSKSNSARPQKKVREKLLADALRLGPSLDRTALSPPELKVIDNIRRSNQEYMNTWPRDAALAGAQLHQPSTLNDAHTTDVVGAGEKYSKTQSQLHAQVTPSGSVSSSSLAAAPIRARTERHTLGEHSFRLSRANWPPEEFNNTLTTYSQRSSNRSEGLRCYDSHRDTAEKKRDFHASEFPALEKGEITEARVSMRPVVYLPLQKHWERLQRIQQKKKEEQLPRAAQSNASTSDAGPPVSVVRGKVATDRPTRMLQAHPDILKSSLSIPQSEIGSFQVLKNNGKLRKSASTSAQTRPGMSQASKANSAPQSRLGMFQTPVKRPSTPPKSPKHATGLGASVYGMQGDHQLTMPPTVSSASAPLTPPPECEVQIYARSLQAATLKPADETPLPSQQTKPEYRIDAIPSVSDYMNPQAQRRPRVKLPPPAPTSKKHRNDVSPESRTPRHSLGVIQARSTSTIYQLAERHRWKGTANAIECVIADVLDRHFGGRDGYEHMSQRRWTAEGGCLTLSRHDLLQLLDGYAYSPALIMALVLSHFPMTFHGMTASAVVNELVNVRDVDFQSAFSALQGAIKVDAEQNKIVAIASARDQYWFVLCADRTSKTAHLYPSSQLGALSSSKDRSHEADSLRAWISTRILRFVTLLACNSSQWRCQWEAATPHTASHHIFVNSEISTDTAGSSGHVGTAPVHDDGVHALQTFVDLVRRGEHKAYHDAHELRYYNALRIKAILDGSLALGADDPFADQLHAWWEQGRMPAAAT